VDKTSLPEGCCAECGKPFEEALEDGTADNWTTFWSVKNLSEIEAETCGEDCADEYQRTRYRW